MRKKLNCQRVFMFNQPNADLKVITEYQNKYTMIDELLEENSEILDLVHEDLEKYSTGKGRDSKFTSENILRMLIAKWLEQDSFRDIVIKVADSAFLRNFARLGLSSMMDFTFLCTANKYIQTSTWEKVNKFLLNVGTATGQLSGEQLRVDSTLCETNIHWPTDSHQLWDSYRVLARLMRDCDEENPKCRLGFRFHDRKIKKIFTYISTHSSNRQKRTIQKVKGRYKVLIERVADIHDKTRQYVRHARSLQVRNPYLNEMECLLPTIEKVIDQSIRRILNGESVPNNEKIFSIFEPHTELIKRGKAGRPLEFGHMVTIGQTENKFISYYDVMERRECDNTRTDLVLENHKEQFGHYPSGFAADKHYYKSMEHIHEWEKKIDTFSVCKKGNRTKSQKDRESQADFKELQKFRAGSEGSISVLKRAFGLKRCLLKGFKSFAANVGCLVFCHNLVLLTRL